VASFIFLLLIRISLTEVTSVAIIRTVTSVFTAISVLLFAYLSNEEKSERQTKTKIEISFLTIPCDVFATL
jgi:hypothetical protein